MMGSAAERREASRLLLGGRFQEGGNGRGDRRVKNKNIFGIADFSLAEKIPCYGFDKEVPC